MSISKKSRKQEPMIKQDKERRIRIPVLKMWKASMLIKQLAFLANKTNRAYGISNTSNP